MRKKNKPTFAEKQLWIHKDPSVRLPYFMLANKSWDGLSGNAVKLYVSMRKSFRDSKNSYRNVKSEGIVSFGPADAKYFVKKTYYRALGELITAGFVEEVSAGGYGRKGVYNLLTRNWMA